MTIHSPLLTLPLPIVRCIYIALFYIIIEVAYIVSHDAEFMKRRLSVEENHIIINEVTFHYIPTLHSQVTNTRHQRQTDTRERQTSERDTREKQTPERERHQRERDIRDRQTPERGRHQRETDTRERDTRERQTDTRETDIRERD